MRRFRFSLLTLLVILTITAVAIVWGQQYAELRRLRYVHREIIEGKIMAAESRRSMYERLLLERGNAPANPLRDAAFRRRRQAAVDEIAKLKQELSELEN